MNSNYDADNFNTAHLQSQVKCIHLSGYINASNEGDEDGNPPTNHWAAWLELVQGGFVVIDMMPGYGSDGLRGKIEISSNSDESTRDAIKTLTFTVEAYGTVQTITDLINSKGRYRYRFTKEWEGCRFWIWTFVNDLESTSIIPRGSGQTAWEGVSYYWRTPNGSEPREVKQGTFY